MSPLRVLFVIFSLCFIHQAFGQATPSNTMSITQTMTNTMSNTITNTMTNTISNTMTNTISNTMTGTVSTSFTNTITMTQTTSNTITITNTITNTMTNTISSTVSMSFSMTISGTQTNPCRCGDSVLCGNEVCDGGRCCTTACTLQPVGTRCGVRLGACYRRPSCSAAGVCRRNVPKRTNAPCVERGVAGTCNSANRCIASGVSPSRAAVSKSPSRKAASKSRKAVSKSRKAASKSRSKKAVAKSPSKKAASKSKKAVSKSKKAVSKSKKAASKSKKAASKSKKAASKSKKAVSKSKKAASKSKKAASKSKAAKANTKLSARYKVVVSGAVLKGKLNLKNKGNNTANSVVATLTFPTQNKFSKFKQNSASICTGSSTSQTITCTLSSLGVEKASIISFVLTGARQTESMYTVKVTAGNAPAVNTIAVFP